MEVPELQYYIRELVDRMPNLKMLSFNFSDEIPMDILHHIEPRRLPLSLNSLKHLEIGLFYPPEGAHITPDWSWLERFGLSELVRANNLKTLHIPILNKRDAEILESLSSPLEELKVKYHCWKNDLALIQVFTTLSHKFSHSLVKLSMTFDVREFYVVIMQATFYGRLKLPKVKILEVSISSMFSLDFLLGMTENLEELKIEGKIGFRLEKENSSKEENTEIELIERNQIINFIGYQERMLESNIWNMFPKLKKIETGRGGLFKKEDWLKLQKEN